MTPTLEVEGRERALKGSLPDLPHRRGDPLRDGEPRPALRPAPSCTSGPAHALRARPGGRRGGRFAISIRRSRTSGGLDRRPGEGLDPRLPGERSTPWTATSGGLLTALDHLAWREDGRPLHGRQRATTSGHHAIHTKGNGHWVAGGVPGPPRPNMFDTVAARAPPHAGAGRPAGREVAEMVTQLDTLPPSWACSECPCRRARPARERLLPRSCAARRVPARPRHRRVRRVPTCTTHDQARACALTGTARPQARLRYLGASFPGRARRPLGRTRRDTQASTAERQRPGPMPPDLLRPASPSGGEASGIE